MSATNFPHGVASYGVPIIGSGPILTTGNVWFCDSGSATAGDIGRDRQGKSPERPFASLDYAIGRCTASNGDIIVLMPGHAETVSAAADIVCDVAGITIRGIGWGQLQPTITFDTADTADIDVTAANVTFDNVHFIANYANVDGAIDVAATGTDLTIQNCRISATAAALDFEEFLNLAAAAHRFSFLYNDVELLEGTDAESLVFTAGDCDSMRVIGNNIIMEASTSIFDIDAEAIAANGPLFRDNSMINLTAAADYCVEIHATTVARFINERYGCAGATLPVNDGSASFFINCQGVDGVNQSSLIFPSTATSWP
jgi:hypothetical protein